MRNLLLWLLTLNVVLAVGCSPYRRLRVGSKDFPENRILAHMIAFRLEEEGVAVKRLIPFGNGDSYDCIDGLANGEIDVYPEYSGTLLALLGNGSPQNSDANLQAVATEHDLVWGNRFGFENSFAVFVTPDVSRRFKLQRIEDLPKTIGKDGVLRLGFSKEFEKRPLDGWQRFKAKLAQSSPGMKIEITPSNDRQVLCEQLARGELDAVVSDDTDGWAAEMSFVKLQDKLRKFFPTEYQSAPLLRAAALQRYPRLEQALAPLAGLLTAERMSALIREVDVYGTSPRTVAARFLADNGLIDPERALELSDPVRVSVTPDLEGTNGQEQRSKLVNLGLRAVRQANPNRRVELHGSASVPDDLNQGDTFAGVVSALDFYDAKGSKIKPSMEAVLALGYANAHLIVPKNWKPISNWKQLGVGPDGGTTARAAPFLAEVFGFDQAEQIRGAFSSQLEALRDGSLDGLLWFAEDDHPGINEALADASLTLYPLEGWENTPLALRYPFLHWSLIPAETYPNQENAIPTVHTQVVLVGPTAPGEGLGAGGPTAAVQDEPTPIPDTLIREMRDAIGVPLEIEPSMPAHRPLGDDYTTQPINPSPEVSILTFLLIVGFGWFMWSLMKAKPQQAPVQTNAK